MKLSVCLIVRNEEARLGAAIDSIRTLLERTPGSAELVITDTGSTDGTVALAQALGARVNHFAWCDDFAAARNACQAHARGEWIFWLDADERLKAGSEPALWRAIGDPTCIAHQVIREDFLAASPPTSSAASSSALSIAPRDRPDWFSEMYQLRLARRDLPCRFVGRIHEHLSPSPIEIAKAMHRQVTVSGVRIQHWGYSTERMPDKLRRAAHLCALELEERPGQLYYLVERMRALIALNDPQGPAALEEATRVLLRHRNDAAAPGPMAASLIEQLLALPEQRLVEEDELLTLARRWFPRSAPLVWAVARTHAFRNQWPQAEQTLRYLLGLLESGTHDLYMSFDPRITEDARFNLGVALVRQAKLDEAQAVFESFAPPTPPAPTTTPAAPALPSLGDRRAAEARQNLEAIRSLRARFK